MSKKNKNRWNIIFYFSYNNTNDSDFLVLKHCNKNYDEITLKKFIEHSLDLKQKLVILNIHTNRLSFISTNKIGAKLRRFKRFYNISKGLYELEEKDKVFSILKKTSKSCFVIQRKSNTQELLGEI